MVCLWCAVLTIFLLKLHHYNVNTGVSTKFFYGYSSLYYFPFNKNIIRIMKYSGKYLQRRIPHASHGSFNPYIITNKEAHIVNGNISVGDIKKNEAASSNQQLQETNNNRRHFMNYCLTHSGRFSCAVDSFLELTFAIFRDSLRRVERNDFFQTLFEACVHLQSCNGEMDMTLIREPVWAYLRQHCNSFATMSADAVFSDIFKLSTVGVMTEELQSFFW